MPELVLQTRLSRLVMMPVDDIHRYIFIGDGRRWGAGITASVCVSAFYVPLPIFLCREMYSITVGRGEIGPPVEELDAELVKRLRDGPMQVLEQAGTAFGYVDLLRSREFKKYPDGMFEYGLALARAGALHEAGRRLLEFMNMKMPFIDRATHRLMVRAQALMDVLYEKDSRRDELFEKWILEGKQDWGLAPEEEEDEEEDEDDDLRDLGEWEPGKPRW